MRCEGEESGEEGEKERGRGADEAWEKEKERVSLAIC